MIINHNIAAINTQRSLGAANSAQGKNMEKLSSGLRINRAGDDAAGLAISEKMRGQIRGLEQASRNAQDGISLIQTAEGALNESHSILQRMRELAVQSASDTNTDSDRAELQKEVNQLAEELTRISTDTEFNTKKLINGSAENVTFQIGANAGQSISLSISDMGAEALKVSTEYTSDNDGTTATLTAGTTTLTFKEAVNVGDDIDDGSGNGTTRKATEDDVVVAGYYDGDKMVVKVDEAYADEAKVNAGINISNQEDADTAITTINAAIESVSAERSKLGSVQNRLEHTVNNLGTTAENLTASESRIRDVDMAKEMVEQTKNSILSQAAQAMLAQANQQPQAVLQLLR
ncbi:flagellin (plasmid) [Paenibacillus urinalis]|uniref:Flagellin n=1 Tax=Paenibacillus urinalis TaxID=521520 RepID=A0ABY7XGY9_9BACL|nr:flagellin [Paenibacillus urinalis]WDI05030.1 flagellin [Paenibacillus urinalis]